MSTLTIQGKFKHGMSIGGVVYKEFELREAEMADVLDAERQAGCGSDRMAFHAELAMIQLTKVTDASGKVFSGPFVLPMLKKKDDFIALRTAQDKLDTMGNEPPTGTETSGTPSSS
jgi:hypothetical protein